MWLLWSGKVVELSPEDDERSDAIGNPEDGDVPVAAVEPITERAVSRDGKAADIADRLRLRLALNEMNNA